MQALDLFCGAGGATCGLLVAGYDVLGVDRDPAAIETSARNGYRVILGDVQALPVSVAARFDLVWGSPPCQPYSASGRHGGADDERDAVDDWIAAVALLAPRLAIMENVSALDTWRRHRERLHHILAELGRLGYRVEHRVLCAADYGVPQTRERLFVIARRDAPPAWPAPTHRRPREDDDHPTLFEPLPPWRGCGEVLEGGRRQRLILDHRRDDGKQRRRDDQPAATVSGVPSQAIWRRASDGTVYRNLSVREGARLQGFPDSHVFPPVKARAWTQIGNAVPPVMARALAGANRGDSWVRTSAP